MFFRWLLQLEKEGGMEDGDGFGGGEWGYESEHPRSTRSFVVGEGDDDRVGRPRGRWSKAGKKGVEGTHKSWLLVGRWRGASSTADCFTSDGDCFAAFCFAVTFASLGARAMARAAGAATMSPSVEAPAETAAATPLGTLDLAFARSFAAFPRFSGIIEAGASVAVKVSLSLLSETASG